MSTIPRRLEVIRDSTGVAQLVVDGTPFPYAIYTDPVEVEVDKTRPPTVRLTLLAHAVTVSDELLADEDLNHDCDDTTPEAP